ncbi:hypothetical protein OF83DRAFT_533157 [Amylostereum chailletii]|nr:hypothetical protein OF83DRAFT_533157 [Amylostereum chailletii]
MLCLPVELQLDIFQRATHDPHLLDTVPDPNDPSFPEDTYDLIDTSHIISTLQTRRALTLVCRTFNALATPLLYQCLLLNHEDIRSLSASLSPYKLSFVRRLILDLPTTFSIPASPGLLSLFTSLPAVYILSIHTRWKGLSLSPPLLDDYAVVRAMARALGPTLRVLVLNDPALFLFRDPAHLSVLTQSLVHLETLVLQSLNTSWENDPRNGCMLLPAALPRLRCLRVDNAACAFPTENTTPTHVHFPLNKFITSVLHPALTHLSLNVPHPYELDAYSALSSCTPSLVSLTLSGACIAITHLLASDTLPPVKHLSISAIYFAIRGNDSNIDEYSAQALVDAIGRLRARGGTKLVDVKVRDDAFVANLRVWVKNGRVDVGGLVGCGFAVENKNGRALVYVAGGAP